ncbi:MAG: tol-pal system-associated acyl-CoA thioesterase [Gammaproteobacteria bacterium]|nr:tol-pal system-associated acyl-CoA thioesterase [Gammaproteobacteria bacterium]
MSAAFSMPVRVYYEDTDAGGVVYYANYLRFMERVRTEWLRALGFDQTELSSRENVVFAVRSVRAEYLRPARLNDMLEITAALDRIGSASLSFAQEVRRSSEVLCVGTVKVACLDARGFFPKPIPPHVLSCINLWRES